MVQKTNTDMLRVRQQDVEHRAISQPPQAAKPKPQNAVKIDQAVNLCLPKQDIRKTSFVCGIWNDFQNNGDCLQLKDHNKAMLGFLDGRYRIHKISKKIIYYFWKLDMIVFEKMEI